jgi:hypothetical protein
MLGGSGIGAWISLIVSYLMIPFTFIYSMLQRALPSSNPPPPTNPRPTDGPSTSGSNKSSFKESPASAAAELRNRKGNTKSGEG